MPLNKKSVLVTGGAGFIGSHLCESLIPKGHEIVCLDNFNDYYSPHLKRNNLSRLENDNRFQLVIGDIRDTACLNHIFEENDIGLVIHLAAMAGVRPSIDNPYLYHDVNVNGTVNILQACHKYNVSKIIYASSSSVYGNNSVPFLETDRTDSPISPYAASKKSGELACYAYHKLYSMSIFCLRFFTVFGPRQRPDLAIHKFARLISRNKHIDLYGDGSTSRDYTFIDDIVNGIQGAVDYLFAHDSFYEIVNLGNSDPVSLKDLIQIMATTFGIDIQINWLPLQMGDVETTFADITKAKNMLDFSPCTTIEEGMIKFKEWFYAINIEEESY